MGSSRFARAASTAIALTLTAGLVVGTASASYAAGVQRVSVTTGDTGNGKLDHVAVTFNTPMKKTLTPQASGGVGAPGFAVDGYTISGFSWASDTVLNVNLVEKASYDTDARPQVRYVSGGGGAESVLGIEADAFDVTATDGAGPALIGLRVDDQGPAKLFNFSAITNGRKGDLATLVFSEPASLAGATNWARWLNLEKAIKFNNEGACSADGTGDNITFNFPQPRADQTAMATIVSPPAGESAREFVVSFVQNAIQPPGSAQFPGVPQGCWLGIESSAAINQAIITDAANNAAPRQNAAGAVKVYPTPVDAALLHAYTKDGLVGDPDGRIDGLEFTFDQLLTTESIGAHLGSVQAVLGAHTATLDVANVSHPVIGGITYTNIVRVPINVPTGQVWDTGARPTVRYTKPGACTSSSGTPGLKAQLPTVGFAACVGSFDIQSYDGAKPVALTAVTTDANLNGRVDAVTITFSEALKRGSAAGWTLDGQPATNFVLSQDKRSAEIPFAEGPSGNTGAGGATVTYTPQGTPAARTLDTWDLEVAATSLVASDGAAPRITDVSLADTDADGSIDRATLTYSEPIVDPGAGKASRFEVGGVPATAFVDGTANDEVLTLDVTVPGTDPKSVSFTGATIADALGNAAGDQFIDASLVEDLAAPQGTVAVAPSAPIGVGTSTVTVTYTEELATAPVVTLGSKPVTGALTEDASVWQGTVDVAEGDCATPTGCAVTVSAVNGEDAAGNVQGAASLVTEIDTIAPSAPTLGSFSATQASGPAAPANTVNALTRTLTVDAGIAAGEAAGGFAELTVDGTAFAGSRSAPIVGSATNVAPTRTFADLEALRAVLLDGTYQLGVRVCDDAGNCADSAAHDVLVDTAGVSIALGSPNDDQVVSGGDVVTIAWDADETALDFSHVELDLARGGTLTAIDHAQGADGTYDWTVPAIDASAARIRATAVDAAGNRTVVASTEAFAIDSTAPVVSGVKAGGVSPFVGGKATVTWSVADATVDRVAEPITIEYSADGGATWLPINGGAYSKADDGSEVWNVPAGPSFALALRLTATDATSATGSAVIEKIARGVAGYVADGTGTVVAFGTADPTTNESKVKRGSWNKAMALNPAGTKGVTVSGRGSIFPFSIGDRSVARKPAGLRLDAGTVRDVALIGSTKGYVLDEHGRLHAFGGAPKARVSKTWRGDMARAVVLNDDRTGGWVLSQKGHVQPFAIGNKAKPSYKHGSKFRGAVDLVMNEAGTGGWILRSNGAVIPVGKGVSRPNSPDKVAGADARALIMVTDTAGYWIGPDGSFHAVGDAFGDPSTKSLRGAVSAV